MKKILFTPILGLISSLIAMGPVNAQMDNMNSNDKDVFKTTLANELKTNLRTLWEDHAMYTRNVILNIIDDLPGTNEAVVRLLKNQDDIGNAIKPLYGEAAGEKLTTLLREHIVVAADLLKAAKINNQADFNSANTKWFKNADDIASFLNAANPKNWALSDMKKMMHDHLNLTTQEAVARLKKDYKSDIELYDKTRAELIDMSDMLAAGIIKQFPDKFK
ncbi:MAG: hypothetical protein ACM3H8_06770 [Sphingobacteriales bacterium]